MINILFWNTQIGKDNKKNYDSEKKEVIDSYIIDLVKVYNCDIVILAEYDFDLSNLCDKISVIGGDFKSWKTIQKSRVKIIVQSKFVHELIRDNEHFVVYNVEMTNYEMILAGVHFPSKRNSASNDQIFVMNNFILELEGALREVTHNNIVIVGDFNANPYEGCMIDAIAMHSIPSSDIVQKKGSRRVYRKEKNIYYNPMWNFLGDFGDINGTCYYDSGGAIDMYWNIFDQALFSSDAIRFLDKSSIKIITSVCNKSLLSSKGIPKRKEISDHLPIFFSMKEE